MSDSDATPEDQGPRWSGTITAAEQTDVGRKRDENQDYMGHDRVGSLEIWVLCDGMGGHAGGSTASRMAVETVLEVFHDDAELSPAKRLERSILAANKRVFEAARTEKSLKGMGTTVVTLLIDHDSGLAHVAHVGDSRLYLAHGTTFQRITRDHTMVQQMVDDGILTPEQAHGHPHGNVISRSLGGGKSVDVEHSEKPIELTDGDCFLLCSDGLTGPVEEQDIAEMVWGNKPKAAAAALIAQANANGGEDNITVQIVQIGEPADAPETFAVVHPELKPTRTFAQREAATPFVGQLDDGDEEPETEPETGAKAADTLAPSATEEEEDGDGAEAGDEGQILDEAKERDDQREDEEKSEIDDEEDEQDAEDEQDEEDERDEEHEQDEEDERDEDGYDQEEGEDDGEDDDDDPAGDEEDDDEHEPLAARSETDPEAERDAADDGTADVGHPILPAVVFGLLIGVILFLAIYLSVNRVLPVAEDEPAVEAEEETP